MSTLLETPTRPRRINKRLIWGLLLVVLLSVPMAVIVRNILIHRMMLPRLALSQPGYVLSVALTPDGKTALAGVDSLDYALDHHLHASFNIPADVFVWDTSSGQLLRRLHGLTVRSNGPLVSPDGRRVYSVGTTTAGHGKSGWSHAVSWDIASGQQLWNIESNSDTLSVSSDGLMVGSTNTVSRAADGATTCQTRTPSSGDTQNGFTPDNRFFCMIGSPHRDPKSALQNDMDGGKSYYASTLLHFWQISTEKDIFTLPFPRVRAFDFSHDGRDIIMTCDSGTIMGGEDGSVVRRIDMTTGRVLWERKRSMNGPSPGPDAILNSVAISPNGKYVVAQSDNSRLIVLDARTGKELFRPYVHQGQRDPQWVLPGGVAFSADGRMLVSRCGNQVLVWDASILQ